MRPLVENSETFHLKYKKSKEKKIPFQPAMLKKPSHSLKRKNWKPVRKGSRPCFDGQRLQAYELQKTASFKAWAASETAGTAPAIDNFIEYYNNGCIQQNLGWKTPSEIAA